MKIKRLIHNLTTALLWLSLFALLIFWMSICPGCTTIKFANGKGIEVYHPPAEYTGTVDETPPSSINPKCRIYFRDHRTQSNKDFEDYMKRIVRGYERREIQISKPVFIKHKYDGINWLMGDYWGAVIYFLEKGEKDEL